MTIKELRKKIEGLDDGVEVVAMGHFGEAIRLSDFGFCVNKGPNRLVDYGWQDGGKNTEDEVFTIPVADIGPEPS